MSFSSHSLTRPEVSGCNPCLALEAKNLKDNSLLLARLFIMIINRYYLFPSYSMIKYIMRLPKILNNFICYWKIGDMKKIIIIGLALLAGLPYQSFAKAGRAYDETEFFLVIVGFLLLVALFFEGIDYLKKNGKDLYLRFRTFLKNKMLTLRNCH